MQGKAPVFKINIIFLISHPYFNLFESFYESCKNDARFNLKVIVYEAIKLSNSTALFEQTLKFLESKKIPFINAMQGEDYIDLKQFKPDVIFLQIPYQTHRPEKYSDVELSKFTNLAHIHYGSEMHDTINSKEYRGLLTQNSLWKVAYKLFSSNHFDANFFTQNNVLKKSQVAVIGAPKVEKILKHTQITSKEQAIENLKIRPFKIAWKPRWREDLSSFETYQKYIIDFISQNPSIELIFIAHPRTEYREKLEALSLPNVKIVEDGDFLSEILNCNIFMGDNCSTTYEFFLTRKPVIECVNNVLPSPLAIKMKSGFYSVSNVDELQVVLSNLLSGKDELFEIRKKIADEVEFNPPYPFNSSGDYLKSILLQDFSNAFSCLKNTLMRKVRNWIYTSRPQFPKLKIIKNFIRLKRALNKYRNKNGSFPVCEPWAGVSYIHGQSREDWIPNLAPKYIKKLPKGEYIYKSDGRGYKVILHTNIKINKYKDRSFHREGHNILSLSNKQGDKF